MEEGQEHSASKQLHAVIQIQALCRKLRKLKTLLKGYFSTIRSLTILRRSKEMLNGVVYPEEKTLEKNRNWKKVSY